MTHDMKRLVLLIFFASACGDDAPENLRFPPGFLYGTATAGFQVDMGCPTIPADRCTDPNSDWYVWVTKPELVSDSNLMLSGDSPTLEPGFYELFDQDFDRVKNELHGNTFRMSIEWSRLFPTSTIGVDGYDALKAKASPDALAFYHAVFASLKAHGLTPFVTLNHYTLPTWIHDAYGCHLNLATCSPRGWIDKDVTVAEIAKYAGFCAREFGGEVDLWATENEPFLAVAVAGYFFGFGQRSVPPRINLDGDSTRLATLGLIEAHARMYDAVKANDTVDADGDGKPAQVGIVYNMQASVPKLANRKLDVQGSNNVLYLMDELFLDGVIKGDVDMNFDGTKTHRDDLANRMDFLGINYYARAVVDGLDSSIFPQFSPLLTFNPLTLDIDYAYPKGIYEVIMLAEQRYGHLPIYITETGAQDPTDDGSSEKWLVETLHWVKRAINDGADVRGYYYWSLMDNYEWSQGMSVKMGLYGMDGADPQKTRHIKAGGLAYGRIAAGGEIPGDLAAKYPIQ